MSKNDELPKGWAKSTPRPEEPNLDWVSLERLLDDYTIPVLAEAVEKLNVQTHDDTGRRILATNGPANKTKSKAFALSHLAQRHFMLHNPGPDDYLFDERLEIEGSPLDLFGWPKTELPRLDLVMPHISSTIKAAASTPNSGNWITQAHKIAQAYIDKNKASDLHPSLNDTAEHVADEMRKLKIYGGQKKPLGANTIKRQALQGEWWGKRNIKKR